ncbi:protein transport protein Sec24C [Planococcus citri]|uniref:protein transport protein Sec24C n=1 Tax=Planococcus citri TaxID=170843 RepID=UPI0031F8B52B
MNAGSYHQQAQHPLQFNINQHHSSPTGSNDADNGMNNHSIPKYPPGGMNTMIPSGNSDGPNMPPGIDHITKNVNKMTVQDGLHYERPSFPTHSVDQNENMASNNSLHGAKNYPHEFNNVTNNIPNVSPASNYQWKQSANDGLYPNNNAVLNNAPAPAPASYTFGDSLQATSNNVPPRPPSTQMNSFPPQNKSYSPAPQNNSYPSPPSQNNSFAAINSSFGGASPASKAFPSQNDSFSAAGPPKASDSFPSPVSNAPYSPYTQSNSFSNDSGPQSNSVNSKFATDSFRSSIPPSSYPASAESKPLFPPASSTMNAASGPQQNSAFPKTQNSFIPPMPTQSYPAGGESQPQFPGAAVKQQSNSTPGLQQNAMPSKPQHNFPPTNYPSSNESQHGYPPMSGPPQSVSQQNSMPPKPQSNFAPPVSSSNYPPAPSSLSTVPLKPPSSFPTPTNASYPAAPPTSERNSFAAAAKPPNSYPQSAFAPPTQPGSYSMPNKIPSSFPGAPQEQSFAPPSQTSFGGPPGAPQVNAFPPSSSVYQNQPPNSGYPNNANGPPAAQGYPPYNQKSAFSPPYSKMPGSPDMPPQGAYGGHQYGGMPQQPPQQQYQRKLDPDSMPNPIEVMSEDRKVFSNKPFHTNQAGLVPPLVSTEFLVEDEGNANPRFIRSTMYNVPCNMDMMKQADVPFSLVITPLATLAPEEQLPPIVNTGEFGPVRCVRCKAYVNPFMKFVDGGRRFVCALCKAVTEVPAEYFQHLDHTGNRVDRYERPELLYGAYEFTVTKEYCKDNEIPKVPALIFVIDVSYNNIKSGMVKILCEQMSDIVQNYLPTDDNGEENPRMRVGFITYDSTVHFYNIKACLGQPQMMIIGDMEDVFVPLLDGFLCDPLESLTVINSLMQQIPATFAETRETDTVLLPAIQAGLEALKAAKCAGKLLVFHSSLPTANAPGKLTIREDRKLLGTDKEKVQLSPQNSAYTNLAQECVSAGCSVDMFIFNNSHIDLATIGQVSKLTGGEIYKYTYFQAEVHGERFIEDVKRDTSRNIAFDAVMRVRTSTGVRPVSFYGHMHMSNTTDIELASINADKSIAVEIKHDDKLAEEDGVFIQVALLYTSCSGQRRVRLLNLALKCCTQMADLYRNCELDTIINYLSKAAVTKLLEGTPRQVKEGLATKCARILACYRRLCADPSTPGQLILPECMKLLPLYTNCLLKSDAISGGSDMTVDDRWYMMQVVLISDIPSSVNYFYPRLIPLVNVEVYSDEIPNTIRCTSCKLLNNEAYLLENGVYMFLWLGSQVPVEWLNNVFGVPNVSTAILNIAKIPLRDNAQSKRLYSLIDRVQKERRHTMRLTVLHENDKMEAVFKHFLVEDGSSGVNVGDNLSSASYVDFLCYIHKEIRNMLS